MILIARFISSIAAILLIVRVLRWFLEIVPKRLRTTSVIKAFSSIHLVWLSIIPIGLRLPIAEAVSIAFEGTSLGQVSIIMPAWRSVSNVTFLVMSRIAHLPAIVTLVTTVALIASFHSVAVFQVVHWVLYVY